MAAKRETRRWRPKPSRIVLALLIGLGAGRSIAARPGSPAYPVKPSADGRMLVGRDGKPFLLVGDSPWGLLFNLNEPDAERYFEARRRLGFNSVVVDLIGGGPLSNWTHGGVNVYGDAPFVDLNDFSTVNERYFAYVDRIVREAGKNDVQIFLIPDDWYSMHDAMRRNGAQRCRDLGRYLGRRYRRFPNVAWWHSNDHAPSYGGDATAEMVALTEGIREFDRRHLQTAEWDGGHDGIQSLDFPPMNRFIGLNGVYTYDMPAIQRCYIQDLRAYDRKDFRTPFYFQEGIYEDERGARPYDVRQHTYRALLTGGTGAFMGNGRVYPFTQGWKDALESPCSRQMSYAAGLFGRLPWWKLVPDQAHRIITGGYGRFGDPEYVTAAATPDGRLAMAYCPASTALTVHLSQFAGPVTASWFDPTSGRSSKVAGSPFANRGTATISPPSARHADGAMDYLLVLEAASTFRRGGA